MINLYAIKRDPEKIKAFLQSDDFKKQPHHIKMVMLVELGVVDPNNN